MGDLMATAKSVAGCSGFKISPQISWYSFLQELELNSPLCVGWTEGLTSNKYKSGVIGQFKIQLWKDSSLCLKCHLSVSVCLSLFHPSFWGRPCLTQSSAWRGAQAPCQQSRESSWGWKLQVGQLLETAAPADTLTAALWGSRSQKEPEKPRRGPWLSETTWDDNYLWFETVNFGDNLSHSNG